MAKVFAARADEKHVKLPSGGGYSKVILTLLIGITIVGLGLRLACCFWGYPYQLHPDEHTVVDNAVDMVSRRSWEAYVYNRPDQFEIKCIAPLLALFAKLKYHLPIAEAYEAHKGNFYLIARFYTCFFGTLLIPMMALFVEKLLSRGGLRKRYRGMAQILVAAVIALSPIYVQHSAYATPDMPLTFFSVLIAYLSIFYIEKGDRRLICAISILTGICITIKYPAAVMCPYIALIVIYRAVKEKNPLRIRDEAIICIGLILLTMFFIAPNLFTNLRGVARALIYESRSDHPGADGLGFAGNLWFYVETILKNVGLVSALLFLLGAAYMIVHRAIEHASLLVFGIYWICLSVLSLHWERWGMPMYPAYVVLMAVGAAWLAQLLSDVRWKGTIVRRTALALLGAALALIQVNVLSGSLAIVKQSFAPATRVIASAYCEQQGITVENSICDSRTLVGENWGIWGGSQANQFVVTDQGLQLAEEQADKRYYLVCAHFMDYCFEEPERYPAYTEVYQALDDSFSRIYEVEGKDIDSSMFEFRNIQYKWEYLLHETMPSGYTIYIYDMQG